MQSMLNTCIVTGFNVSMTEHKSYFFLISELFKDKQELLWNTNFCIEIYEGVGGGVVANVSFKF